ncbi:MAG: cation diffusion facilitator family transporter [bacterium]|nr:cation diffusion facilitator family transporter [bacterium]
MQIKKEQNFNKLAYIEGWLSIGLNVLLFIAKYVIGLKINSVALQADAWHTLSDSLTSIILIFGIYLSAKPADEEHPFGHGRIEKITSLLIGIMLILVAINFLRESAVRITSKKVITFTFASILIQAICAVTKQSLALFAFWAGKKSKINAISADAWHHQSDAITSVLFIIGVFLSKYIPFVDGYLGLLISFAILMTAMDIIKSSASPLIGEKVPEELIAKVTKEVSKVDSRITGIHHFHMHRYGNHIELTFHIRLPRGLSLEEAHEITKKIENALFKEKIEATIHVEPYSEGEDLQKTL